MSKNNPLGQFVNRKQESHKTIKWIINNNIEIAQKIYKLLNINVITFEKCIDLASVYKIPRYYQVLHNHKIIFFQEHPQ